VNDQGVHGEADINKNDSHYLGVANFCKQELFLFDRNGSSKDGHPMSERHLWRQRLRQAIEEAAVGSYADNRGGGEPDGGVWVRSAKTRNGDCVLSPNSARTMSRKLAPADDGQARHWLS
jgi:hypothetical protein